MLQAQQARLAGIANPEVTQPASERTIPCSHQMLMVGQAIALLGGAKSQPPAREGRMEA